MKLDIKIPEVGESVQEAVLVQWYKHDGERVAKGEVLFILETDKVTLEITAEADGVLHTIVPEGETVSVGAVVGTLDTGEIETVEEPAPVPDREGVSEKVEEIGSVEIGEFFQTEAAPSALEQPFETTSAAVSMEDLYPSVRKLVAEKDLDLSKIQGSGPGGRITKGDVLLYLEGRERGERVEETAEASLVPPLPKYDIEERITRKTMSPIRRRIAQRLLEAKQQTAMLTTFNEIDMSRMQAVRAEYKEKFKKKYGVSLGVMSFFVKAAVTALKEYPEVNAFIEGDEIIYHHYCHIGVAIGAERGLVVPVIRDADRLSFAEIEQAILDFVQKIKENRLELSDLEGGTFTITNGGVFGSLLSTPILNPPQSGILGMHKIEDRPIVAGGEIVIRPMMYVALTYDHRVIDGREAVSFLKRIKECIEDPERMMLEI